MGDNEIKQALRAIRDECQTHDACHGCKFRMPYGCILKGRPDKWIIGGISTDKWHTLYSWLVDLRSVRAPEAREGLKEYTIKKANADLLDEILEYMNELDKIFEYMNDLEEEKNDET